MRIAFVTPRYGPTVIGGAESAVRELAEGLVELAGDVVEVHTTTASDHRTWANTLPVGTTEEGGVRVSRYRVDAGRAADFDRLSRPILAAGADAGESARAFLEAQGPVSKSLLAAIRACSADLIVFYPYLYLPTVDGIAACAERAVLHPAAHDEPPLALACFVPVFTQARALVFQTQSERRLVNERFATGATPQLLLGLPIRRPPGLLPPPGAAAAVARLTGGAPYFLALGRIEESKGTSELVARFSRYRRRRQGSLRLVLAGPVVTRPPRHPDVVVTGPVGEQEKWALLAGARALVVPSRYEAFSLVLLEAFAAGRPVVVNGRCGPTREHVEESGGGFSYLDQVDFEAALARLEADPAVADALGAAGRSYVTARFERETVLARYRAFLVDLLEGPGAPPGVGPSAG